MNRMTLAERLGYGFAYATSLTVLLAWSPTWQRLPDVSLLLGRYAAAVDALPGAPNTGLAFLVALGVTYAALFFLREPTAVLGGLAAVALGTAAYPYGNVKWHLLFAETVFDQGTPTIGAWLRALVPILLLLVPPVLAHTRDLVAAYKDKGIERAERVQVQRHLLRGAGTAAAGALAISLAIGALTTFGGRLLASETRLLGRNSAVVMLIVALLLVFALGIGTGLFGKGEEPEGEQEEAEKAEA